MATAEVLDFARLLLPIAGDSPVGVDLRTDISPLSDYQRIKEDRKAARQTETQIDRGAEDLVPPDWRPLVERAVMVLAEKSKDMEVTAYLIEGLTRTRGFAGVRDGFRLVADLIEQFGDQVYPSPGDSDIESRFSHMLQLNGIESTGALIVPIAKVPMTAEATGPFALTDVQLAQSVAKIADPKARQSKIDEGAPALEQIQKAIADTPGTFYRDLVDDLRGSLAQFERFCSVLSAKTGYDPPADNLRSALENYLAVVSDLARAKIPVAVPAMETVDVAAAETPGASATQARPVGAIRSREDALDALQRVAEYFRLNEPQSILPFALEQVIRWGRLPLPDLLQELIPDEEPLKNLFKQVGIKPP